MDNVYCSDFRQATVVVFDHFTRDTVYSECGLMLESHSIDETSEWRTFANDGGGVRSFCRDTVCSECGLMLESHSIDETSEWRTFANDGGGVRSFCRRHSVLRVRLLTDGGLSTIFSKPNGVTSNLLLLEILETYKMKSMGKNVNSIYNISKTYIIPKIKRTKWFKKKHLGLTRATFIKMRFMSNFFKK
ncbi:hypothetical protein ACSBR2_020157 [Camellia fascicularis]